MENPKNVTGPEETEVCIGCGIGFLFTFYYYE